MYCAGVMNFMAVASLGKIFMFRRLLFLGLLADTGLLGCFSGTFCWDLCNDQSWSRVCTLVISTLVYCDTLDCTIHTRTADWQRRHLYWTCFQNLNSYSKPINKGLPSSAKLILFLSVLWQLTSPLTARPERSASKRSDRLSIKNRGWPAAGQS